jgi:hypothetical protein
VRPRRAQRLRERFEIGAIAVFERLPVQIKAVETESIRGRQELRDEGRASRVRSCAAPAVDLAGAADHQHGLAPGRMRGVDRRLRPDRTVDVVDVEIGRQRAIGLWACPADHEVRDRAEIDFGDRVEIVLVADVITFDPARRVEAVREDRIGASGKGARSAERAAEHRCCRV